MRTRSADGSKGPPAKIARSACHYTRQGMPEPTSLEMVKILIAHRNSDIA